MKKKLIILTGVSGVGKSTVSSILYEDLDGCFYLEGDKCGIMNPCRINEENVEILLKNISHILNNYIKNTGSENIVFAWNIYNKDIVNKLLGLLDIENVDLYKIILTCSKEELKNRIQKSIQDGTREETDIEYLFGKVKSKVDLEWEIIDTTKKTPNKIAEIIKDIIR